MKNSKYIIMALIIIVGTALLGSTFYYSKNISKNKDKLYQSYFEISNQYKRKALLLNDLRDILVENPKYAELRDKVQVNIIESGKQLDLVNFEDETLQKYMEFVKILDNTIKQGNAIVTTDRVLKKKPAALEFKKKYMKANIRIKVSQQRHNRTIKQYNEALNVFPQNLLNDYYYNYDELSLW